MSTELTSLASMLAVMNPLCDFLGCPSTVAETDASGSEYVDAMAAAAGSARAIAPPVAAALPFSAFSSLAERVLLIVPWLPR